MKIRLKEITGIILVSILLSVLYNSFSAEGLPLRAGELRLTQEQEIDIYTAKMLWFNRQALFVDARSADLYESGHITDAISLPLESNRNEKIRAIQEIPKDKLLVVYCRDEQCTQAERLAGQLSFMGFQNLKVFSGGWMAWQGAGLPYEKNNE